MIDKHVDRYRPGKRTLTHLCQHYAVPLGDAHSADADALTACRVAWRQGTLYPQLARMSLDELHQAQIGWAVEQAASLQAHFRETDPEATVEGAWPVIPRQRSCEEHHDISFGNSYELRLWLQYRSGTRFATVEPELRNSREIRKTRRRAGGPDEHRTVDRGPHRPRPPAL